MLTEPEKEIANVKSGRPLRRLILIQIILLAVAIVDACFLTAHYGYGVWVKNGSVETGGIVKNDPRWIAIRSCYKLIQLIILTVMLYLSCLVFYKTSQAIKSDEGYSPLRRQVNIFMSAWLLQLFLRYFGYIYLQGEWLDRNIFRNETNVYSLGRNREISCIVCTTLELISDIFLVIYLFIGRSSSK